MSLQSRHLKYLTVRQTGDGQRCEAHGDVQKEDVAACKVQMVLAKPSLDARAYFTPAKEWKHRHYKR